MATGNPITLWRWAMAARAIRLLAWIALAGAAAAQEVEQPPPPDTGERVIPEQPQGPESGARVVPDQPEAAVLAGVPRGELIADHQLGPFVVRPQLTLEFGYDSNVFIAPDSSDPVSSRLLNVIGDVRMLLPGGERQEFEFDGSLGYHGFLDQDSQSFGETSGQAVYRFKGTRHLFEISDRYDVSRRRYSLEIDERVRFRTNEVRGFWEYALTEGLGLRFGAHRRDFKFASGETFGDVNLAVQGNHTDNGIDVSSRIRVASTVRLFGQGEYRRISFEESDNQRDSTERFGEVGFEFDPSGALRGEAALAYTEFVQPDNDAGSFSGLRARANLRLRLGESAELELSGSRAPQASVLSQSVLNESLRISVTMAVGDELVVNAYGEAVRDQYRGESTIVLPQSSFRADRTDRGLGAGLGATYQLGSRWGIVGRIRWFRRNSEIQDLDYDELEALIGLRVVL